MFRRVLVLTVAAASLAAAAPAFAGDARKPAEKADVPACCAQMAATMHDLARAHAAEVRKTAANANRETDRSWQADPADVRYQFDYQGG